MSDSPSESLTKEMEGSARTGNSKRTLVAVAFTGLFVVMIITYLIIPNDEGEHPSTNLTQNTLNLSSTTKPGTQIIAALETTLISKPQDRIKQSSPDSKSPIETALSPAAEYLQPKKIEESHQEIPQQSQLAALESPLPGGRNASTKKPSLKILAEVDSAIATDHSSDPATVAVSRESKAATESLDLKHPTAVAQPLLPPNIIRAQLTNGIKNREPIDRAESVISTPSQGFKRLFYFTEFRGMKGQKVFHRWEHEGHIVAEVKFNVGGNRWRVYSSKNLIPSMEGEWKITITDATGKVFLTDSFVYN